MRSAGLWPSPEEAGRAEPGEASSGLPKSVHLLAGLEQAATTIRQFDLAVVPGLLQTSDYAPEAGVLYFTRAEIAAWIGGVQDHEFDDVAEH